MFSFFDVEWYKNHFWVKDNFGITVYDDVGFIRDLIERIQENYNINPNRIYITGISNGADMTYYLGSEFSDIFAAIAPVAGSIGGKQLNEDIFTTIPEPENPVSVIVFDGMNDSYDGGTDQDGFSWLGVNESVSFWVEHNNCDLEPEINISESENIITRMIFYIDYPFSILKLQYSIS